MGAVTKGFQIVIAAIMEILLIFGKINKRMIPKRILIPGVGRMASKVPNAKPRAM